VPPSKVTNANLGSTDDAVCAAGVVRMQHEVELPVHGDRVSFTTTFTGPSWVQPEISRSTLSFLELDSLSSVLSDAGLAIEEQFGDWDGQP
jgi:hypothetical protein